MNEKAELQIYDQLARYVGGEISLKDFRDWFDSSTWDQFRSPGHEDAFELAAEIELRLAEFSNGHWSESDLRDKLKSLLRTAIRSDQTWGELGSRYRTSSASATQVQNVVILPGKSEAVSPTDIRLAWERA